MNAIIIDNKTVIPNISVNRPFSDRPDWKDCNPELPRDEHDIYLSESGAINFCEIVQLYHDNIHNNKNAE